MVLRLYYGRARSQIPGDGVDVSIQEAAQVYGVAPATIRRWIKSGKLAAYQHDLPQGFEWRVQLPDHAVQLLDHNVEVPDHDVEVPDHTPPIQLEQVSAPTNVHVQLLDHDQVTADDQVTTDDQVHSDMTMLKALEMVDRLQQQNMQLAGQVGYLQAQLQDAREQVRMLADAQHAQEPPAPDPKPKATQQHTPWWRRLLGR